MAFEVVTGDCREVMAEMAAESVDAIVCDPPYELTNRVPDVLKCVSCDRVLGGRDKAHATCPRCGGELRRQRSQSSSGGFMGKRWDATGVAFDPDTWREALRVLKPGAHLLAFGGSRTYHRLACAIEDAGFEIRDQLQWLYGSGFPKSLDVSKAIDKRRLDDVRPVCRFLRAAMDAADMNSRAIAERFGFHSRMVDHWAARDTDSQPSVPTPEQWLALKDLLGFGDEMDAEVWRLNGRKGQPGEAWHEREVIGTARGAQAESTGRYGGWSNDTDGDGISEYDITAPATDLAQRWQGFGTALKPAHEPIVLARKPLSGTVAANVAAHGTGALNIAACRIESDGGRERVGEPSQDRRYTDNGGTNFAPLPGPRGGSPLGRWPANVCLDEDAAALLDAQSGERKSPKTYTRATNGYNVSTYGSGVGEASGVESLNYGDTGGASRFYYVAKASRAERNAGLDGMPERVSSVGNLDAAGRDPENAANYYGTGAKARIERGESPTIPRANHHPTVKPIELMRWLVRLITPPGGLVFDPFLGSGSTGCAAAYEGFDFLGCDLDAEYVEIARRRIAHHAALAEKARESRSPQLALFDGEAA